MNIHFLGTGTSQGVPVIACNCKVCTSQNKKDKRLRTSALISINQKKILIDAGPDFRQQLLREHITHLDAIVITHAHKDHIGGLDDVRALNYITGKPIDIYGEASVLETIRNEFPYAFAEMKYPGVPEMNLIEISDQPFDVHGICITPIRVMHFLLPILGFRIGELVYITDANAIADSELLKMKDVSVLVLNALRHEKHISHFTLSEAIQVAQKVNARQTYFTHISHQMGLHDEIEFDVKQSGNQLHFAYDGLKIRID